MCGIFTFLWSLSIKINGSSHSNVFLKYVFLESQKKKKKTQENTCEKVHVHVYFSKILRKLKVISSDIYGKKYFQGTTHFFWIKIWRFLKQTIESFGPNKTTLYFWLKINLRKMASNKHIKGERRGDI